MKRATNTRLSILWLMLLPPGIWAMHFLAVYVVAAVYCAKSSDVEAAITATRVITAVVTVLALAAIAAVAWYGRRHYRLPGSARQSATVPGDQSRFAWGLLLLLCALSALAVICAGAVPFFFGDCR